MKKICYLFLCLFILLFTGCTKEENLTYKPEPNYEKEADNTNTNEKTDKGELKEDNSTKVSDSNNVSNSIEVKDKPVLTFGENSNVLWTFPYNSDKLDSVKYIPQSGEWGKPLGLYSYAISKNHLFVDDSANHRIVWFQKDKAPQFIDMPEEMIAKQMTYVDEEDILYILLFNNLAVEPDSLSYARVDLNNSLAIENIKEVPYDTWLSYLGQPIEESMEMDTSFLEEIQGQMDSLENLKGRKSTKFIKFITECDGISLYVGYWMDNCEAILLLLRDNKIIAYSEIVSLGEYSWSLPNCAYMYVEEGTVNVTFMIQKDNEIEIISPRLLEVSQ